MHFLFSRDETYLIIRFNFFHRALICQSIKKAGRIRDITAAITNAISQRLEAVSIHVTLQDIDISCSELRLHITEYDLHHDLLPNITIAPGLFVE